MTKPMIITCPHTECGKKFSSTSAFNMHTAAVHKMIDKAPVKKDGWLKRLIKKIFRRGSK